MTKEPRAYDFFPIARSRSETKLIRKGIEFSPINNSSSKYFNNS
ncbi:6645_t:CDS:1, partial [Funneliformis geosporum]